MADGWREADIIANYPRLTHEDIAAGLAYFDKDFRQPARVTRR
jgi:uncharacterized protein (DUF433 family)